VNAVNIPFWWGGGDPLEVIHAGKDRDRHEVLRSVVWKAGVRYERRWFSDSTFETYITAGAHIQSASAP